MRGVNIGVYRALKLLHLADRFSVCLTSESTNFVFGRAKTGYQYL